MHVANLDNLHYIMHAIRPLSSLQMTTNLIINHEHTTGLIYCVHIQTIVNKDSLIYG